MDIQKLESMALHLEKDAKALFEEAYENSLKIASGFDCYWTGFIQGYTMALTKVLEELESGKR